MSDPRRQTRTHLTALFKRHGLHPRTDLGQNFLIDLNVLDFVVREAHLEKERDVVLEVGAGTAGMTAFLSEGAAAVVSVEVDRTMHKMASEALHGRENVTLLQTDALKNKNRIHPDVLAAVREKLDAVPNARLKLVANLPYNIATPIISNLAGTDLPWSRMVAMIQLELAQRMTAKPSGEGGRAGGGGGNYGALSAWVQTLAGVKLLKRIPPSVFWPRPGVDSAVIRLNPNPRAREQVADLRFFQDFLRRLFHHRRKLMRGVLCGMYRQQLSKPEVDGVLALRGFDATQARAEQFGPEVLRGLANALHAAIAAKAGPSPVPDDSMAPDAPREEAVPRDEE